MPTQEGEASARQPPSFLPGPYLRLGGGWEEGLPPGKQAKIKPHESRMIKAPL